MPFCAAASNIEVPGGQLTLLSSMLKTIFSKRLTPLWVVNCKFKPKQEIGILPVSFKKSYMEYWSVGVMEYWDVQIQSIFKHYSITPVLHHSSRLTVTFFFS